MRQRPLAVLVCSCVCAVLVVAESPGWQAAEQLIIDNMNQSADPCVDFYNFVCGNFKVKHSHSYDNSYFAALQTKGWNIVGEALKLMAPDDTSLPSSYRKAKLIFDQCMGRQPSFNQTKEIDAVRHLLMSYGGWPIIDPDWSPYPDGAAGLFGALLGTLGVEGIMLVTVTPNVWDDMNARYALMLAPMYYQTDCYDRSGNCSVVLPDRQAIVNQITAMANKLGGDDVDPMVVEQDANEIADIVINGTQAAFKALDNQQYPPLNTNGLLRVLGHAYHPFTVSTAIQQWPDFNWPQFLINLSKNNTNLLNTFGYKFAVASLEYMDFVNEAFKLKSPRQLQNYLLWTLVQKESPWLQSLRDEYLRTEPQGRLKVQPPTHESQCAQQMESLFPNVLGRILVENSNMTRHDIDELSTMVGVTLEAWHGMISEVPWMDSPSRSDAYAKIDQVARKVAFPDWILNDHALDQSLEQLDIRQDEDGLRTINEVFHFAAYKAFSLMGAPVDRYAWTLSPAILNAWYKDSMNSITFTAAIMQPPFFNHEFPKSFNYAHIGHVMGHELGHGFDSFGIYWGPYGEWVPDSWVDEQSISGYNTMAQCLIDEYNQFCYPDLDLCINGTQTITENIADNGGLNAAYRSYKAMLGLMGGEAPYDGPLAQYDEDQRFFLAFANIWCSNYSDDELTYQLLNDVHSPMQYRVTGTLLNMPEFAQAFNCPVGSPMAPADHCSVWVKPH